MILVGNRKPTPPCVRVRTRRFRDLSPEGPEVRYTFRRWRFRRFQGPFGLHPIRPWSAQPKLIGWRIAIQENRALLFTITVRAFIANATNMPSADFCREVGTPYDVLSHETVTPSRSPEVSSTAFRAPPPNLRFASLMELGFAITGPLARRSRLLFGFCPSARSPRRPPRFLQTPPHGDALALR